MTRHIVYMGKTSNAEHVYAEIEIRPADDTRQVTFTDHSTGPRPETVSISFSVTNRKPRDPRNIPDSYYITAGQVPADERVIAEPAIPASAIVAINQSWKNDHLNELNAACDHMTPEMLAPLPGEPMHGKGGWQYRMLDTMVCPVTGYKWGSAWLTRTVDTTMLRAALEYSS